MTSVWVVGSCARGTAALGSDIDLLVDGPGSWNPIVMQELQESLSALLARDVDIIVPEVVATARATDFAASLDHDRIPLTSVMRGD